MPDEGAFDPDELQRLVDEALSEGAQSTAAVAPSAGLPLAFNDSRLLEVLSNLLPKYLDQADAQVVLSELRDELYSGIQIAEGDLRYLHTIVSHCRRCPEVAPKPILPRWNLADPDVVFVAENMSFPQDIGNYLVDAMRKAGFSSRRSALTAVTRCPMPARAPQPEEVQMCSRFLSAELQLLRPKLIVALGATAVSALIKSPVKITEERGRIYWVGPWPVMATFSPAYAMRKGAEFDQDLAKAHQFCYGDTP